MVPTAPNTSELRSTRNVWQLDHLHAMNSEDLSWQRMDTPQAKVSAYNNPVHGTAADCAFCAPAEAGCGPTNSTAMCASRQGMHQQPATNKAAWVADEVAVGPAMQHASSGPERSTSISIPPDVQPQGLRGVDKHSSNNDILPIARANSWAVDLQMLVNDAHAPPDGQLASMPLEDVQSLKQSLRACAQAEEYCLVVQLLQLLAALPMTPELLAASQIGRQVKAVTTCTEQRVASLARHLVASWERIVLDALATTLDLPVEMPAVCRPLSPGRGSRHPAGHALSTQHAQICASTPASGCKDAVVPVSSSKAAWDSPFAAAAQAGQLNSSRHAKYDYIQWGQKEHGGTAAARTADGIDGALLQTPHESAACISTHHRNASRLKLQPLLADGNSYDAPAEQLQSSPNVPDSSPSPASYTQHDLQQPASTPVRPLTLTAEQQKLVEQQQLLLRQLSSTDSLTAHSDGLAGASRMDGSKAQNKRRRASPKPTTSTSLGSSKRVGPTASFGRTPTWTEEEAQTFLDVLKEHGRSYAKLMEALPRRPKDQIRNWFNNHKVKLNLNALLLSHGHCLKVKNDTEPRTKKQRAGSGPIPTLLMPPPATGTDLPPSRAFSMPLSPTTPSRHLANHPMIPGGMQASRCAPTPGAPPRRLSLQAPEQPQPSHTLPSNNPPFSSSGSMSLPVQQQYNVLQPIPPTTPFQSWQCRGDGLARGSLTGSHLSELLPQKASAETSCNTWAALSKERGATYAAGQGWPIPTLQCSGQLPNMCDGAAAGINSMQPGYVGLAGSDHRGSSSWNAARHVMDPSTHHRLVGRHGGMGVFTRRGPEGAMTDQGGLMHMADDNDKGASNGDCGGGVSQMGAADQGLRLLVPSSDSGNADEGDGMRLDAGAGEDDSLYLSMEAEDDDNCMMLDLVDAPAALLTAPALEQQFGIPTCASLAGAATAAGSNQHMHYDTPKPDKAASAVARACGEDQGGAAGSWQQGQASSGSSHLVEDCFLA